LGGAIGLRLFDADADARQLEDHRVVNEAIDGGALCANVA
jgi:hypothetical protein